MLGITSGVDLLQIDRLTRLNPAIKARFLARVFTPREIDECADRDDSLAGHFAAKEATAKALGCGIGEVGWKEIEILADERGKPRLLLHASAQETANRRVGSAGQSPSVTPKITPSPWSPRCTIGDKQKFLP